MVAVIAPGPDGRWKAWVDSTESGLAVGTYRPDQDGNLVPDKDGFVLLVTGSGSSEKNNRVIRRN
jgi:hypothetical protein